MEALQFFETQVRARLTTLGTLDFFIINHLMSQLKQVRMTIKIVIQKVQGI